MAPFDSAQGAVFLGRRYNISWQWSKPQTKEALQRGDRLEQKGFELLRGEWVFKELVRRVPQGRPNRLSPRAVGRQPRGDADVLSQIVCDGFGYPDRH